MTDVSPHAFIIRSPVLPSTQFIALSAEFPPKDGTKALTYRRDGSNYTRGGLATFKDGVWTNARGRELSPDGLYWVSMHND